MAKTTVKELVDEHAEAVKAENTLRTLLSSKEFDDALKTTGLKDPRGALMQVKDTITSYRILLKTAMEHTTVNWPAFDET